MAWVTKFINRTDSRAIMVIPAILFALPLGWGAFTGITIWFSPFVMLNSVFVLKSVVWLNTLALGPLLMLVLKKRWFCHYLCPLGWGCDLVSSARKGRGFSVVKIPPLGKWMALASMIAALAGIPLFMMLDPMAIFNSFFVIVAEEIKIPILLTFLGLPLVLGINFLLPGIWCNKLCPLGGLQDEIYTTRTLFKDLQAGKHPGRNIVSTGRRFFLVSGSGLLAALVLPSFLKPGKKDYLKPPGSLPADSFNTLCLRCGSCIKSCPTGILEHHMDSSEVLSWMVPEVHFKDGYCLENCNTCSRVCPSGAISLFDRKAKSNVFIGSAEIKFENCLLSENKECDRCKTACPFDAITIQPGEDGAFHVLPQVDREKCVGCGACMLICPTEVIDIAPFSFD